MIIFNTREDRKYIFTCKVDGYQLKNIGWPQQF